MLFLEHSIFSSFTSHPRWPKCSLAKLLFSEVLFLTILFLTLFKFSISCCTFFNTPSQQERDYQQPWSCLCGTQTCLLTMPLSKYLHPVPRSKCTTTSWSSWPHNPIDDDSGYLYAWTCHETLDSQRVYCNSDYHNISLLDPSSDQKIPLGSSASKWPHMLPDLQPCIQPLLS